MPQKTQAVIDREVALESFVVWLAQRRGMAEAEMARRFFHTKTCALLMNVKSSLWEESNRYILDLLELEEQEDWDGWIHYAS